VRDDSFWRLEWHYFGHPALFDLNCQGKVESSAFEQSRKFRFWVAAAATHGMFDPQRRGRAWCLLPKADATELAPKQSANALL
jgi:hypothetical protein